MTDHHHAAHIDTSHIRFYVTSSRTDNKVAVAGFMLRLDANMFVKLLHEREGTNGPTYKVVSKSFLD